LKKKDGKGGGNLPKKGRVREGKGRRIWTLMKEEGFFGLKEFKLITPV